MSDFCDPKDRSQPGSSVRGILPSGILEWVAFPSPGNLPDQGIELAFPALAGRCRFVFTSELPGSTIALRCSGDCCYFMLTSI